MQAIVFDCFGVLTSEAWIPFKKRMFGSDPRAFKEASKLTELTNSGKLEYRQFLQMLAEMSGMNAAEVDAEISKNVVNEELFAYIKQELAPTYKIGMLSNASANWIDELFTASQKSVFNSIVLSCDIGRTKPHPEAYKAVASKLGVPLHECVFIDDIQRYCEGAREAGMHAIWFKDTQQCIAELKQILSVSDSNK